MSSTKMIAALADKQHGLVTRRQLLAMEMTKGSCEWRVETGALVPVHPGIYRLAGAAETPVQAIQAACLATSGIASHRSAALLLNLPIGMPADNRRGGEAARKAEDQTEPGTTVDVSVPVARRVEPLAGVRIYRSVSLERVDLCRRQEMWTTSVPRTLIDLAGALTSDELAGLTDHALARRLVKLPYLVSRLEALGIRGRKGARVLAGILAERQGQSHFADSQPQRRLRRLLVAAGLPVPQVEYQIDLPDGTYKFVDFAWLEPFWLALEVNSFLHHSSLTSWTADQQRNNRIVAAGWRMGIVTPTQINEDPPGALQIVAELLGVEPSVPIADAVAAALA